MLIAQPAFPHYVDTDGSPITSGSLYYGSVGANPRTSPVAVYWDAAGTQPAPQPIRTVAGYPVRNGSPANVYVNGAYSVALYNAAGELVFYAPDSADFDAVLSATSPFMRTLLDDPDAATARATLGVPSTSEVLLKAGGTMTGKIVLDGNASDDLHAVPKQQVESIAGLSSALSFNSLALSATGTNANISVSASELLVRGASNLSRLLPGVAVTINTAAAGANGLDTGALASSTWYSVWVIWNGTTTAGLISTSATSPTMPTGYTHKARVGWIRTDGTASKFPLGFTQRGRRVQYLVNVSSNVPNWPQMASGSAGDTSAPAFATIAVGNFVPPTAGVIDVLARIGNASSVIVAPNGQFGGVGSSSNPAPISLIVNATTYGGVIRGMLVLESSNLYWACVGGGVVCCVGWEDNL